MLESHKIYLYDRIKETSYVLGTQDFVLNGPVNGFSPFGSVYQNGDNLFYAATDGTFYEVGSGVYVTGVQNYIVRYPFRSSSNNQKINFGEGLKEIFATYPATHSVYSASGLQNNSAPQEKGLAFWSSSNIINYDNNLIWDSGLRRLGIQKNLPVYAIDIGGPAHESIIRSSGISVGASGIIFPFANNGDSSYIGGVQLTHYEPNNLESSTDIDAILELSGVAKNSFLLKQQNAGLVFAGPVSGCTPPCSPDYPNFRPLFIRDIGEFDGLTKRNRADDSSFNGFRFDRNIGINENPNVWPVFVTSTEPGVSAALARSIITPTQSGPNSSIGLVARSENIISSGITNTGWSSAIIMSSLRNSFPNDEGYVSGIFGSLIVYGNDNNYPQTPFTDRAFGIYISPQQGSGTIREATDLFLSTPELENIFGTVTNHFGIIQRGSHKKNLFEGQISVNGIYSSGDGLSERFLRGEVNCFNNSFDPLASGTWLNAAYTGHGIYGGGIALLDTISANPNNQYGYSIYTTEQGINLNFSMANVSGVANNVLKLYMPNQNSLNQATMAFYGDKLNINNHKTPASASATGVRGDICWDSNFIYVCVNPNTWKRSPLSTW